MDTKLPTHSTSCKPFEGSRYSMVAFRFSWNMGRIPLSIPRHQRDFAYDHPLHQYTVPSLSVITCLSLGFYGTAPVVTVDLLQALTKRSNCSVFAHLEYLQICVDETKFLPLSIICDIFTTIDNDSKYEPLQTNSALNSDIILPGTNDSLSPRDEDKLWPLKSVLILHVGNEGGWDPIRDVTILSRMLEVKPSGVQLQVIDDGCDLIASAEIIFAICELPFRHVDNENWVLL